MTTSTPYMLFTDGGARGNPGPAGIGYSLQDGETEVLFGSEYINQATNNTAEYQALITALSHINRSELKIKHLECKLDSQLVVMQILGKYKVKQPHLQQLLVKVKQQLEQLKQSGCQISISHIPRNQNKRADQLVNQAIDASIRK